MGMSSCGYLLLAKKHEGLFSIYKIPWKSRTIGKKKKKDMQLGLRPFHVMPSCVFT